MAFVVLELAKRLPLLAEGDTVVLYSSRPVTPGLIPGVYENVIVPAGFFGKFFWFRKLRKADVDVLVFVAPLLSFLIHPSIKTLIICQELSSQNIAPKKVRDKLVAFLRDRILAPRTLTRATHIITPSEATRQDVITHYRVAQERIHVVPNGFQDLRVYESSATPVDAAMVPYFFFAGATKYRKNVHGIVRAFIMLRKKGLNAKLVIAGGHGEKGGPYTQGLLQELDEAGLRKDAFFVGYINREQLYAYYKQAVALVFPSFSEGFGMPIIEAMNLGTPVVTSNYSAMAEVGGDAALLVDPHDPADIAVAMEQLLVDDSVRTQCVERGLARAKLYSWDDSAAQYLETARQL